MPEGGDPLTRGRRRASYILDRIMSQALKRFEFLTFAARFGVLVLVLNFALRASAIGWSSTDFLVSGGPQFSDRIAVFGSDLSYKGLLDPNFFSVQGLDFDAAGHLVSSAGTRGEVRVYDSSGQPAGGF